MNLTAENSEIAHLRARLEELERAVHNQNLEVDGQTFAGKVMENQKLRAEVERLKQEVTEA